MVAMETIGERVRRLREEMRLSQGRLAKLAQVTPSVISDLERGRQKASRKIDLIAAALGTTPSYLRTGTGPRYAENAAQSMPDGLNETARDVARAWMESDPVTQANICTLLRIELKALPPAPFGAPRGKRPFIKFMR